MAKKKLVKSQLTAVVGIGASAGGVHAIRKFLESSKDVSGIAYVLVQHMSEAGAELAHDVLKNYTEAKVVEIKSGLRLKAGCIFHSPSHADIRLEKGVFKVSRARKRADQISVIDTFFRSLAVDQAETAIGIVLSGVGSDGALGLKAISQAGGMTIAQMPESAEFPSMPEGAIGTGAVDHVLIPEEMPRQIESYANYLEKLLRDHRTRDLHEEILAALPMICDLLVKATRHDFKHYKASTLVRRIQRRMQVLQCRDVESYISQLTSNAKETDSLFKELLINVTCFFRDPVAFDALKTDVIAKLLSGRKPDHKLRIWVAGCSTGEEAYTIAILVREVLAKISNPPEIQIIATDIDEAALNIARKGSYPVTIAEHVSPARLKKFFVKKNGRFAVSKELREIMLFSSQNLINDPPFSQLDLISCRNVLIYLGAHLQKKLIPVFHYALRPGGFLFLGSSESLTSHRELFRTVSAKLRIGQRKATAIRPPGFSKMLSAAHVSHQTDSSRNHEADVHLVSQRILLDEFSPKYAVVNDDGQIVSVSSGIAQYLDPSEGAFQNNLLKLVKPSLRVALRSAFQEARKRKRQVNEENSTLKIDDRFVRIGITVQPMPHLGDESSLFMVVFHYFGTLRSAEAATTKETSFTDTIVVEQLERELATLRTDLDRSVQDLEASNEELKSSNEELLSMNEELQSANEELETSKEDVQGANDALQKNNNDLENLLGSTEIATLFLDDELRIQSFTPKLETIYNISKVDIGRPITDITSQARVMPKFPRSAEVSSSGAIIEHDIEMLDRRWVLRRISPYRTFEGHHSGVVVTFIDVTHLRKAEENYRQLADSMPQIVWTADPGGKLDYYNERWYEFTGHDRDFDENENWLAVLHPDDAEATMRSWAEAVRNGTQFESEFRFWDRKNSSYRWYLGRAVAVRDSNGRIVKWYGSSVDIHDRVMSEAKRRESERRFQIMADTAPVLVWISGVDKQFSWFNRGWLDWTGRSIAEEVGTGWLDNVYVDDLAACRAVYADNFDKRTEFYAEYRLRHRSGTFRWVSARGVPRFSTGGVFEGFIGGCMDIHDNKIAQQKVAENEVRLETMIRTSPSFMCLLSGDDYVFVQVNDRYLQLVGHRDIVGKPAAEALPETNGQGFYEILDEVRRSRKAYIGSEMPIQFERTPGAPLETRYIDFVYQPDVGEGDVVSGIFVHGNDVTEKVQARAILENSKALIENERENFRNLFKQTPELVCILSGPEHRFDFVNEAHVRVLGFDATGMTVREAQPESIEAHVLLDRVYKTGVTAELDEVKITVGDRIRYFNLTYAARRDAQGKIDGIMVLGAEITQEVLNRTELEQAKASAEKARAAADAANESKTRFLANMSHEIRTPLAAVLGFSELLKGRTRDGDTDAAAQLDRISRNAAQLGRLIDELLDLSKIEADKFEVERSDFDLQAALDDALASVSLIAQQKGLVFESHGLGDVPKFIRTDSTRFKQILINIIGNAVKFTHEGRIDVELSIANEVDADYLQVKIRDTGIGLSPEQRVSLFEPFTQADTSVTRQYGGTGLGLALSRRLARLLGGDLTLTESALGKGSTFILRVRIESTDEAKAASIEESKARSANVKNALSNRSILLVDDSADNQTIIRLFLKAVGGEVELANNGLEAVERMRLKNYDVVLMDIQMPVMDGYQALRVANESGYKGPIVALTAHALKEEKDRCIAAGFTDYISKPIDRKVLIGRLVEILNEV